MNAAKKKIVFDCERMKHPHTGLYHFCLQLSRSLVQTARDERLCFYLPSSLEKILGEDQCYLRQHSFHKAIFPSVKNITLWHCAHQSSDYFPFGKKLKKLLTIHDLNYLHDSRKSSAKKKAFIAGVQRKIDEADGVVFISNYTMNDVRQHVNIEGKKTAVIYNGCTIQEILSLSLPPYVPPKPFLFTLGTITDKKNFHVLPRLLPGNDFLLVIAGVTQSESYKEKILAEAALYGVTDRVIFTGPVWENDKQWYLKNCTAFVFPSLAEGFGLPVLEAMYFEKPVLLSKETSLPEIGGDAADYFSNFNAEDMQTALQKSLQNFENNPAKKQVLKARALSFSWTEAAEQYHKLYRELLGEGKS